MPECGSDERSGAGGERAELRGFARIERDHLRAAIYPHFEWAIFDRPSPRRRLEMPLRSARVALISTAGARLRGQPRFSRGNRGDASFRAIPSSATDIRLDHTGYDTKRASQDLDTVLPLRALSLLAADGVIGELASRAFSFMGYIPDPTRLLSETGPAVARELRADAVDLALLVPA